MYNLFVSADEHAWSGEPWKIYMGRCVREYTSEEIQDAYGNLGHAEIDQLKSFPCIFAFESFNKRDPHFGLIRDITVRHSHGLVKVEYDLHPVEPFLTAKQLKDMAIELDIGNLELNRTHWAAKEVNLPVELRHIGIHLPHWADQTGPTINLDNHQFDVALSFPGKNRDYVEKVVQHLERLLGPDRYFYDQNYIAQLARPSLDTFLQEIYRARSLLVVVFIGKIIRTRIGVALSSRRCERSSWRERTAGSCWCVWMMVRWKAYFRRMVTSMRANMDLPRLPASLRSALTCLKAPSTQTSLN